MDEAKAAYNSAGQLVCAICSGADQASESNKTIQSLDPTTARNLWAGAGASAFLGLATFCCSFTGFLFFVAGPAALLIGVPTAINMTRDPLAKQRLGSGYPLALTLCVIGIASGIFGTITGTLFMFLSP